MAASRSFLERVSCPQSDHFSPTFSGKTRFLRVPFNTTCVPVLDESNSEVIAIIMVKIESFIDKIENVIDDVLPV